MCIRDRDGVPRKSAKRFISVGSLGAGYLPSAVFGVFSAAQKLIPGAELQLLTRTDRAKVDEFARAAGCDPAAIKVNSCQPHEVPGYLQNADVGLCMIQPSFAKTASSPTKLAEYFACGVPTIANCAGIGDMTEIVTGNRTGADVTSLDTAGYEDAVRNLVELMQDDKLSARCRELAKSRFSLEVGVSRYAEIYSALTSQ